MNSTNTKRTALDELVRLGAIIRKAEETIEDAERMARRGLWQDKYDEGLDCIVRELEKAENERDYLEGVCSLRGVPASQHISLSAQ